jgi:hypothetical protein
MPELEIPLTCPECGAGMSAADCAKCGYRVGGDPIEDDPPTDERAVVRAPRVLSAANRRGGDGYSALVVVALFEWAAGAVALLAGLRWLKLIPRVQAEPDAVTSWMGSVALIPGGGFTVTAASALFIVVGAFLLMRRRWAWAASFALFISWLVGAFVWSGSEVGMGTVALMVPAAFGFFLLILGWSAPK